MKKSDIATIVLIAGFGVIVSYFAVSALPMFKAENQTAEVPTATPMTATVEEIDKDVFNSDAVNPTVEINIDTPDNAPVDVDDDNTQTGE